MLLKRVAIAWKNIVWLHSFVNNPTNNKKLNATYFLFLRKCFGRNNIFPIYLMCDRNDKSYLQNTNVSSTLQVINAVYFYLESHAIEQNYEFSCLHKEWQANNKNDAFNNMFKQNCPL